MRTSKKGGAKIRRRGFLIKMKLYHFTSRHHIEGCKKEGLRLGMIPVAINPPRLIPGFQWLTKRKRFSQSWCDPEYSSLPYSRNEYRITIKIPRAHRKNLARWLDYFERKLKDTEAKVLNEFGDPWNWYLFKGIVAPEWFKKINRNPYIN